MSESQLMCPHCGWIFPQSLAVSGRLVPAHDFSPGDGRYAFSCDGSMQNPRNPESDKRPLWKDRKKEGGE